MRLQLADWFASVGPTPDKIRITISLLFYLFMYCILLSTQFLRTWIMPPLHLLAYSTLLGTELYQTFFMTKVTFQALPRKVFVNLQMTVFLVYFYGQTLLLLLVALTIPPRGVRSLIDSKTSMIIFAVAEITALLNILIYGPRTQALMCEREDLGMYCRARFRWYRLTTRSNPPREKKKYHGQVYRD
ncbi:hypothetical protein B5807_05705 [Epicoccum nigrum]|jgi:hypothetical protein|uniref:TMEM205-like domain-containing protein n=1 Tax=Epicoccum nigrum TaxID=105696 RepID=A0A1Y2LZK8_EPING|nr:hypothetical protein B5807_05705 [Epicoccum nigrum]